MWLSFCCNCLIVIMAGFAFWAMFTGWDFMGKEGELESPGLGMFRYFTIDSNVLMGICSLVTAIAQIPVLTGQAETLSPVFWGIKLMGTSAVLLTFLVTVFFLMPQFEKPYSLFYNSNLFFHLLIPLLAAAAFVGTEHTERLPFRATFLGVLPTLLYEVFYVIHVFSHLSEGKVDKTYDFYNFLNGKKEAAPIAAVLLLLISWLLSLLLWWGNRIGFAC